jgi:hypothetical protein
LEKILDERVGDTGGRSGAAALGAGRVGWMTGCGFAACSRGVMAAVGESMRPAISDDTHVVAIWDIIYGKKDGMIDLSGSLTQGRQQITYYPISISSDCYMGFGIRL